RVRHRRTGLSGAPRARALPCGLGQADGLLLLFEAGISLRRLRRFLPGRLRRVRPRPPHLGQRLPPRALEVDLPPIAPALRGAGPLARKGRPRQEHGRKRGAALLEAVTIRPPPSSGCVRRWRWWAL